MTGAQPAASQVSGDSQQLLYDHDHHDRDRDRDHDHDHLYPRHLAE